MRGNRIRIGFHRIGIALAIIPALAAVATFLTGAYEWVHPLVRPPVWEIEHKGTGKSFELIYGTDAKTIGKKAQEAFSPMAIPDDVLVGIDKVIVEVEQKRKSGLELVAISAAVLALSLSLYAVSWLVGWIVRGFVGQDAA